ncbi:MAG: quinone-dependent dihydroorotate dehydrogenase [Pseudomonadota bacterium]
MKGIDPWPLAKKLVFTKPPEDAHDLALRALELGLMRPSRKARLSRPALQRKVAGLVFPNPIGVAAGFDKNGRVPLQVLNQGFGFIEVGTVTPRAQVGNPKPRVFRLVEDEALINRLGFNNEGLDALAHRLAKLPPKGGRAGMVGINIGANKDSDDRAADYVTGVRRLAQLGDYITINVSSPNTPGLRDLQGKGALAHLLDQALEAREKTVVAGETCPLFVKIAPDLDESGLSDILDVVERSDIDGLVVANTSNARPKGLRSPARDQSGGLSGKPLFEPSTAMLRTVRERLGRTKALIGVGGVDDAESAQAKLDAGADLVQLYTGYVFRGPGLIGDILDGLDTSVEAA